MFGWNRRGLFAQLWRLRSRRQVNHWRWLLRRVLLTRGGTLKKPLALATRVLRFPTLLLGRAARAFQWTVEHVRVWIESSAWGMGAVRRFRKLVYTDEGVLRKPWQWLLRLFIEPLTACTITPLRCLWIWLASRPFRQILWGSPVILLAVLSVILMINGKQVNRVELIARYRAELIEAQASGDKKARDFWMHHLLAITPEDPQHQFERAIAAWQDGKRQQALTMMQRLAPETAAGYPKAHFWIVNELVRQNQPLDDQLVFRMRHHLMVAATEDQFAAQAQGLMGQLALSRGQLELAASHYELARAEQPEVLVPLAATYRELGRDYRAESACNDAIRHFRTLVDKDPLDIDSRLNWARCLAFNHRYQSAIQAIEQRPLNTPRTDELHYTKAHIYLQWYHQVAAEQPDNRRQQLVLLGEAQQADPSNTEMLLLLLALIDQEREFDGFADQVLREALAAGVPRGLIHLIFGTRSLKRGDVARAELHLQLALDANPSTPIVMNNLTWAILGSEKPDLDRALRLIQSAAALSDVPNVRGTQAVVLLRLGRIRESISLLEEVLARHPDPEWVHRQLASAYRAAGNPEMAIVHEQMSDG